MPSGCGRRRRQVDQNQRRAVATPPRDNRRPIGRNYGRLVCHRGQPKAGRLELLLLEGKNAVIYGAAGSIGGAVARAFAGEGARVHLAGRTLESLEEVAQEIRSAGGAAETAQVDALDETGGGRARRCRCRERRQPRHLLQPDLAPFQARHAARGDGRGGLHARGHDGRDHHVPHGEGRRTPHDRPGLRRDPHVRRLRDDPIARTTTSAARRWRSAPST